MTDLEPCPFCGSTASLEENGDHHGEWFNLGCSRHWENPAVEDGEQCPGGRIWYTEPLEDKEAAIQKWNTRFNPSDDEGVSVAVDYLLRQLKLVVGPCQTDMWESPDGQGGQFSDRAVALRCWLDRAITAIKAQRPRESDTV